MSIALLDDDFEIVSQKRKNRYLPKWVIFFSDKEIELGPQVTDDMCEVAKYLAETLNLNVSLKNNRQKGQEKYDWKKGSVNGKKRSSPERVRKIIISLGFDPDVKNKFEATSDLYWCQYEGMTTMQLLKKRNTSDEAAISSVRQNAKSIREKISLYVIRKGEENKNLLCKIDENGDII